LRSITAIFLLLACRFGYCGPDTAIDKLMSAYRGDVPGASVLIVRDGRVILRRAYGLADLEHHVAASAATNYRLASMTKQFTAAAVLILVQDRRLSLDDPIRKWLPVLPDATSGITIRQLLTHTSGLIDYEEVMPPDTTRQLHDIDVLHLLEKQNRTYFQPGTRYLYSNSGYCLLSLIVAKAAGTDFASFLRERIFQPVGMKTTVAFEEGISKVANRAYGYSASEEKAHPWLRTDQSLTSAVLGDGGIYSSIDDLAKWDNALYGNGPLSNASLRLAFTPATHTDDPNVDYGFGWRISGTTVWHSGETQGFRNVIIRYPKGHFTVIVLTNRNDPEPYTIALAIAKLFIPDADAKRASQIVTGPDSGARPIPQAK
jgi:CubicO group peptidase (beta-lactamase class C family)